MEPWIVITFFVLGFFLTIGLIRAVSRRFQYGWNLGDFIMELLLLDAMGNIFSGLGDIDFDF